MGDTERCKRCGAGLEHLRHPVRRLRWTRYWWKGVLSYFTGQLRICARCGAIYTAEGELLAAGAAETAAEVRLNSYRKDMAGIRDGFAAVVIAAELAAVWLVAGAETFDLARALLAGGVGVGALGPFVYFARKARIAKRDLKQLREARRQGAIPAAGSPPAVPPPRRAPRS